MGFLFALWLTQVSDHGLRNENKTKKLGRWGAINTLHVSYRYVTKEPAAKLLYTWLYRKKQLHRHQSATRIKDTKSSY